MFKKKFKAIFVISGVLASVWKVFIKFHWHYQITTIFIIGLSFFPKLLSFAFFKVFYVIFVISGISASFWKVFIKFRWHGQKLMIDGKWWWIIQIYLEYNLMGINLPLVGVAWLWPCALCPCRRQGLGDDFRGFFSHVLCFSFRHQEKFGEAQ